MCGCTSDLNEKFGAAAGKDGKTIFRVIILIPEYIYLLDLLIFVENGGFAKLRTGKMCIEKRGEPFLLANENAHHVYNNQQCRQVDICWCGWGGLVLTDLRRLLR